MKPVSFLFVLNPSGVDVILVPEPFVIGKSRYLRSMAVLQEFLEAGRTRIEERAIRADGVARGLVATLVLGLGERRQGRGVFYWLAPRI